MPRLWGEHATFLKQVHIAVHCAADRAIVLLIGFHLAALIELRETEVTLYSLLSDRHWVTEINLDVVFSLDDVSHDKAHALALKDEVGPADPIFYLLVNLQGARWWDILSQDEVSDVLDLEGSDHHLLRWFIYKDCDVAGEDEKGILRLIVLHPNLDLDGE